MFIVKFLTYRIIKNKIFLVIWNIIINIKEWRLKRNLEGLAKIKEPEKNKKDTEWRDIASRRET